MPTDKKNKPPAKSSRPVGRPRTAKPKAPAGQSRPPGSARPSGSARPPLRRVRKRNSMARPFWMVMVILAMFAIVFHFTDLFQGTPALAENEVRVSFLDMGQGDSIFIQSKGHAVLIDGGEYSTRQVLLNYLREADVRTLDYLVATHPHSDHIGGLPAVINELNVKHILMPDSVNNTASFDNLLAAIEDNNIPVTVPSPGDRFRAGLISLVTMGPAGGPYDNINNDSLVLKLIHGDTAFLFTGDAEHASERDIIANGLNLQAQVLKAGHHGSRTATSAAFLDAVNPRAVVVTCGRDNSYNHPHPELLDMLEQRNIPLYRTDLMGTIVMGTDGRQIKLYP